MPPEWEQYPTCDNETFTGTKETPNIMLVLDTSGSMADPINCPNPPTNCPDSTSKIVAVRTAVDNILTLNATETVIRFGLTTFPAYNAGNNQCATGTIRVPLQVTDDFTTTGTTDTNITTTVNGITPANSTPTGPTLQYLDSSTNCPQLFDSTRDNYIILATDGMPNCPNSGGNGPTQAILNAINALTDPYTNDYSAWPDFGLTLSAVIGLNANNILTFVIGLGDANDPVHSSPNFLNRLALAGGEPQSTTTTPYYYPATSAASLNNVLMQIGNSVLSCKIKTALDPGTDTTLDVNLLWLVYNNGTKDVAIPRDPANGFEYIGNNTFEVYGTYCTMLKTGQISKIDIVMACNPAY